jgi:hypothetical protein
MKNGLNAYRKMFALKVIDVIIFKIITISNFGHYYLDLLKM